MRHTYLIIILLFCGLNLFAQNDKLLDLIVGSIQIYEPNPIHLKESEKANKMFTVLFKDSKDNSEKNIKEQFDNLYRFGYTEYEDDLDMRRIKMSQCLCLASIAVLSDKDRYEYFIDLAEYSITDSTGKAIGLLEKQICGLILLKIYLDIKFKTDLQNDLNELNNKLDYYKDTLPGDFYHDSKMIIDKYKNK